MNDEYFRKMVEFALIGVEGDTERVERLRRQIEHCLRHVERDARHAAMERVYECANAVNNPRYPEPR